MYRKVKGGQERFEEGRQLNLDKLVRYPIEEVAGRGEEVGLDKW